MWFAAGGAGLGCVAQGGWPGLRRRTGCPGPVALLVMIRDRRDQDLVPLCDVIGELSDDFGSFAGVRPLQWLQEIDAEVSWVFDQAPVSAAPTRNVVGHVQIYEPPDVAWARDLAALMGGQAQHLLVIGRLFVKPSKHDYNIARFLLRESVRYVDRKGTAAVLDPGGRALIPSSLPAKLGFTGVPTGQDGQLVRTSNG